MTYGEAMRTSSFSLPLLALVFFTAACAQEEEPVANRFERARAEIENKAAAYEAQADNEVAAAVAALENEAEVFLNAAAAANHSAEATPAEAE